jgi:transcription antitermination factor NusG
MLSQTGEALSGKLGSPARERLAHNQAGLRSSTPCVTGSLMTNVSSAQSPSFEHDARRWFAVVTTPQHEKAASRHLDFAGIETFLPTYESSRTWKNRQTIKLQLPLFPTYLLVRIDQEERASVLRTPGVRQLVGNSREPLCLADREIAFIRTTLLEQKAEPHVGLIAGQRVRIKHGPMRGVEGSLVRKSSEWRFVLTVQLIHHHVAVEVEASTLEPIIN